jgi:phospholipid/cholesterol/gamma-HCH transport system substrate-binding protein
MERAVGWFVILATALLFFGFGYYVYKTAQRKGWFLKKITYQTCVSTATGLKIGDPVKLMGYEVGDIVDIIPNDPYAYYNITIHFRVKVDKKNRWPGYIWTDSKVKVNASDFLGSRYLEITKGAEGVPIVMLSTNGEVRGILRGDKFIKAQLQILEKEGKSGSDGLAALNVDARARPGFFYTNRIDESIYFLDPLESPAVTERLDKLVSQAEAALPNILNLTNSLGLVLSNSTRLTANLAEVANDARPAVSNLSLVLSRLDEPGALGDWLLPTNINAKLDSVLGGADATLVNANTNLVALAQSLNQSLENLSNITSNLNSQVEANTNILSQLSKAVVDADNLVQGLKRHWLLRSAFKSENTNARPVRPTAPLRSPKDQGTQKK